MTEEYRTTGLAKLDERLEQAPVFAKRAARLAVNDAARTARAQAKKEMLDQVAWGSKYLGRISDGRLRIASFAREGDLEARIVGQFRPTQLSRFLTNRSQLLSNNRRGTAKVRVRPGSTEAIERAFLVRLRAGKTTEGSGNWGLAIRLKQGEQIRNKKQMTQFDKGAYLLYGPSVDQVFQTVREDIQPEISDKLTSEFDRQWRRLNER